MDGASAKTTATFVPGEGNYVFGWGCAHSIAGCRKNLRRLRHVFVVPTTHSNGSDPAAYFRQFRDDSRFEFVDEVHDASGRKISSVPYPSEHITDYAASK